MDRIFFKELLLSEEASKHSKKRCMSLDVLGQRNVGGSDRYNYHVDD